AGHLGLVHQRTAYLLRTGDLERPSQKGGQLEPPPTDGTVDWAARWHGELLARLQSTDPDAEMWSFFAGGGTAGWWARRMAHETAVHRVDAEQATGGAGGEVDAALAIDGVDEVLDVFLPTFGTPPFGDGETVHLHATDAAGEWLLTLGQDVVGVGRGHAKGDAAVRGPSSSLYLWLWGRAPLQSMEVFGDPSVAAALRSSVAASTG
ncbi:MAG TPA: maleylpyruvate isomerase family mycothiol-dependent enzyme, partial [Acidimicrobiia bacterium]|nr:maleylpyruvate isomerase family mycothiol-dependent enzyme [Acidimicrobiia bacterium]